jgi:hypothetical protein
VGVETELALVRGHERKLCLHGCYLRHRHGSGTWWARPVSDGDKRLFFMREEVLGYKRVEIGMGKVKKYVMASRSVLTLDGGTTLK